MHRRHGGGALGGLQQVYIWLTFGCHQGCILVDRALPTASKTVKTVDTSGSRKMCNPENQGFFAQALLKSPPPSKNAKM